MGRASLQMMVEEHDERRDRQATARWIWSGGAEPVPAEAPSWREDSLGEIQGVLLPALREAVPSLDAQAAVDALYGAFAKHYQADRSEDAELLQRIGDVEGDALVNLVRAGVVKPRDILPVGLSMLSALAQLCRSDSPSLLQP